MSDQQNNPFNLFTQFFKPMEGMQAFMPPMSEEECARKISELKTVEQWLTLQVGMVQMSIKTLELQQASLAALKPRDKPATE
ncbi:PhaM family polyhydroxyalkanoate granule multifunctional regulatory protein [Chitinimonas sp. BJYL2]|uniref:PhaM family polyhydroxyalkanoate granule multifunctional regulatory protein n=1 Tax=Chitinimonas sp. BJYL2 TaxID=2976696 RepID=UPI0022B4E1A6|nr:PhaM family polyhydroxyalkanoate granule multifunctional regulatory protein [Chitinimonas sp. BJYL2]